MLYVIYGTDFEKKTAKKEEILKMLRLKRPDAEFFSLEADTFTEEKFESLYSSQGLFEKKQIVVLNGLLFQKKKKTVIIGKNGKPEEDEDFEEEEDKGTKKIIMNSLSALISSESMFILFDDALDKKTVEDLKKTGAKLFELGEKKEAVKDNLVFDMCDAYGRKDKKNAWVIFQKLLRKSDAPEAIQGALFASVKNMYLTKKTKNAEEAGVHPFAFGKAKQSAKNFTEDELNGIMAELIDLYHKIRMDGGELSVELEKFLLK